MVVPFDPDESNHDATYQVKLCYSYLRDQLIWFNFKGEPAAFGDSGLQVFMNTVMVNVILVLIIIIMQNLLHFYFESAIDHFILFLKALTPIIWIYKSSKLKNVLKELF